MNATWYGSPFILYTKVTHFSVKFTIPVDISPFSECCNQLSSCHIERMFYVLGLKPSSGVSGQHSPFFGQKTDHAQGHRRAAVAVSRESYLIQMNAETYEPRKPRASDYFRCTEAHFQELEALWDDRYANRYGFWR